MMVILLISDGMKYDSIIIPIISPSYPTIIPMNDGDTNVFLGLPSGNLT